MTTATKKRPAEPVKVSPNDLVESLHADAYKKKQGVAYQGLFRIKTTGQMLRIEIYVDSYDFQSHAWVEVFAPQVAQWNRLWYLPYPTMKSSRNNFFSGGVVEGDFRTDRIALLTHALVILGVM